MNEGMKQDQPTPIVPKTRGRVAEQQIAAALKDFDNGTPATEICRRYGVSPSTFYKWRAGRHGPRASQRRKVSAQGDRPGSGRPARISTDAIVEAALAIGLGQATVRNVAAALGMSFTGLYHHVRTKEELLELVADAALADIINEPCNDADFEQQVLYYSRKFYDIFIQYPQIVASSLAGYAMYTERIIPIHEQLFAAGVRSGFSVSEAYRIFMNAMSAVNGAAVMAIGERAMKRQEGQFLAMLQNSIESQHRRSPLLTALIAAEHGKKIDHFQTVRIVIRGSLAEARTGRPTTATQK